MTTAISGPTTGPAAAAPIAGPETRRPVTSRVVIAAGIALLAALLIGWIALSDGSAPEERQADPPAPGTSSRTSAPTSATSPTASVPREPSPTEQTIDGQIVPADAVGRDAKALEQELKERGYDADKVDVDASAPRDTIVSTIPAPGQPLAPGQSVLLISSKGEVGEPSDFVVPDDLVGTDVKSAEERLKDQDIDSDKADVDSDLPKGQVVATYPEPGTRAEAGVVVLVVSRGP